MESTDADLGADTRRDGRCSRVRILAVVVVWAVAIGGAFAVAAATSVGPVVIQLSHEQGLHSGDLAAVAGAGLLAFALSVVLLWPCLRRRPRSAAPAPVASTPASTPAPTPTTPVGASRDRIAALAIAATAAIVASLSPASPVGSRAADMVWTALAAGLVVLAASRAGSGKLLWLAGVTAVVSVRGDAAAVVLGLASLVAVLALIGTGTQSRAARSGIAALAVLAMSWGPSYGFSTLPSLVAAAAVAPVLWAGWSSLGRTGRRRAGTAIAVVAVLAVAGSAMALVGAAMVRVPLTDAAKQAKQGLQLVSSGDVASAVPILDASTDGFRKSADTLDGPLAWPGRLIPFVGHQVEAMRRVSLAGRDLSAAARDASIQADYRSLRADGGKLDLTQLAAMQAPVNASLEAAHATQAVVSDVRSPWLLGPLNENLNELRNQLIDVVPSVERAATALEVAPALLGGDRPHRYLLQLATPGESRAAGGYIGTYGVLVTSDGQLDLQFTSNTVGLNADAGAAPRTFDPPPGWDDLYSGFRVDRFPGNVTADPDWPTDSTVARQLYEQVPGVGPVDGVLYADPAAMAALLSLTGPVYVPTLGQTLDATNVEQYLLVDQYVLFSEDNEARREALGEVTDAMFEALKSRDLPPMKSVLDALAPAVAGGHLKLWVFDEQAQPLLDDVGLSGAWDPAPGADYLSLRSTDLMSNKIDTFVRRSVSVEVEHDATSGEVRSTVTVTLTNTAPTSGLPWYIIGNYSGLPGGTSRDEIAVYSPLGLESATIDGQAVTMQGNAYRTGNVYAVPVQLTSGQTRQLTMTLRGTVPPKRRYLLDLLPQPRSDPDRYSVTLREGAAALTPFDGPLTAQTLVTGPKAP